MSTAAWRVVMLDSGPGTEAGGSLEACVRFTDEDEGTGPVEAVPDATGHGTRIASVLQGGGAAIRLSVAQVLGANGRSSAATVARALGWAAAREPHLVHLSLGLPADRLVVAEAIRRLVARDIVVVASAPVRGAAVFPAAYPGVLAATGDARCGPAEISVLGTTPARFGGCPVIYGPGGREWRGASIGAAHVSGFIAANLDPGAPFHEVVEELARRASHHGPERRSVPEDEPVSRSRSP